MLVVVQRLPPSSPDALRSAADVTGLAPAEVRTRLAGPLPRVLQVEPDEDEARRKTAALEALGFVAIACDPRAAPSDDDRLVARALDLWPKGLLVTNVRGEVEDVPASAITLIQRGTRVDVTTVVTKKSERRLDLTRAVLSGGLLLTRKVETKTSRSTTSDQPFLLIHRHDGGPDVVIYQHRIDYRFLGPDLAASSTANFGRLIERVRALAPTATYDDRVGRPGLVSSLPSTAANNVDLALWLVLLTHLRGGARR